MSRRTQWPLAARRLESVCAWRLFPGSGPRARPARVRDTPAPRPPAMHVPVAVVHTLSELRHDHQCFPAHARQFLSSGPRECRGRRPGRGLCGPCAVVVVERLARPAGRGGRSGKKPVVADAVGGRRVPGELDLSTGAASPLEEGPEMDRPENSPLQNAPRSRGHSYLRFAAPLLSALLLAITLPGCQIIIGSLMTLQGRPKTTCEFTRMTHGKSMTEKGKKVLVVATASSSAQFGEPSLVFDVIGEVSRRLKTKNVDVVDPHLVGIWIDDNGGINEDTSLDPLGNKFNADYIILINFTDFGYHEQNSPNLYRGHAAYKVAVAEMVRDSKARDGKRAKLLYSHAFSSKYPQNRPQSVDEVGTPELFKSKYMARLSVELERLF